MGFSIVNSYSRVERWSAYDTDEIYYIEVKDDYGKIHKFSGLKPFTVEEVQENIDKLYDLENKKQRKDELIKLKQEGRLNVEQAFELLDMLI